MQRFGRVLAIAAIGVAAMMTVVDVADARRAGGGFGSRGSRTFSAPPVTRTAPAPAAPIDRTMTPRQSTQPSTATNPASQNRTNARPGFFNGFGGSMLGGLMMGGLIGMLLGHGVGGGIGFLGLLLQVGLVVLLISLAMRFFGRNQRPAYSAPAASARSSAAAGAAPSFRIPRIGEAMGGAATGASAAAPVPVQTDEISVGQDDLDRFEAMLKDVQAAYGAEDYAALRKLTTPEAMSYLAEELSDNATKGLKNEVRDVHLVQGDLAEAWRENGTEYATVAMRYESIDVMRDRATGRVVSGNADEATDAVEIWTFARKPGADWQVSAIQGVEA
ncbi:Tim44 domain-containing protein [Sinorhizobium prairiense]|uniref:Tim44 domain-containing protein n=1 Tax=unclassified Sinorhizobium TaxID=2613772 RepID=UPI0023D808DF|nr:MULTISPECIES: Tim44 domain-containing protein [unclassified Sinorhizobium]WEJ09055.1 Tim44 domain-containing protein [Sinorhizobium sp. M103]WEJ16404.1 Tim44 domain-containing protein [Sinorhizobium sp. K101]WEJ36017.1 Tim44 domain-containing protein [Sinorhizobium sp. C101]